MYFKIKCITVLYIKFVNRQSDMYYITWKEGFLYLWSLGCQQCLSPAPKLKEKSV